MSSAEPGLHLSTQNLGKRFGRDWLFRRLNLSRGPGSITALIGPNGSGKSTLIQVLAGWVPPSEGELTYTWKGQALRPDQWHAHLALAAPYLELIEEFSLDRFLDFHLALRPLALGLSREQFLETVYLAEHRHKDIALFSSGMKTRLKLGLALLSQAPLVFLDEPTANLDARGIAWYQGLLAQYVVGRTVFIASNQPYEYELAQSHLNMEDLRG